MLPQEGQRGYGIGDGLGLLRVGVLRIKWPTLFAWKPLLIQLRNICWPARRFSVWRSSKRWFLSGVIVTAIGIPASEVSGADRLDRVAQAPGLWAGLWVVGLFMRVAG